MKKKITILCCITALLFKAQTVTTDNTFGTNGISVLDNQANENGSSFMKSFVQTDGKVVVSGSRINGTITDDAFIARFDVNGTLDTTFGNSGYFTPFQTAFPNTMGMGSFSNLFSVGNKILVFYPDHGTIFKLNNDGSLDLSFGTNGSTILASTSYVYENVVLGNYLYSVKDESSQLILDKIDINTGSVVSSSVIFGLTNIDGIYAGPNGKLIVSSIQNSAHSINLINTDGSLDTTFGTNGSVAVSTSPYFLNGYYHFSIDNNQNIIYGYNDNLTTIIKKYSATGVLETNFGNNGSYTVMNSLISGLKIFSNKIYFMCEEVDDTLFNRNILLGRLNFDGTIDNSFDNDGVYIYSMTPFPVWANSFNVLDNSIIVAGGKSGTNNSIYNIIGKFNLTSSNLGIYKANSKESISFENPVRSNFVYKSKEKIAVIELYSADGKLIKTFKENNQNITELPKGVYFVNIKFQNGTVATKKMIKK